MFWTRDANLKHACTRDKKPIFGRTHSVVRKMKWWMWLPKDVEPKDVIKFQILVCNGKSLCSGGLIEKRGYQCCSQAMPTWRVWSFGLVWEDPLFCLSHMHWEDEMMNVVTKRCWAKGCDKIPNSGLQWKKPLFCLSHWEEGMIGAVIK